MPPEEASLPARKASAPTSAAALSRKRYPCLLSGVITRRSASTAGEAMHASRRPSAPTYVLRDGPPLLEQRTKGDCEAGQVSILADNSGAFESSRLAMHAKLRSIAQAAPARRAAFRAPGDAAADRASISAPLGWGTRLRGVSSDKADHVDLWSTSSQLTAVAGAGAREHEAAPSGRGGDASIARQQRVEGGQPACGVAMPAALPRPSSAPSRVQAAVELTTESEELIGASTCYELHTAHAAMLYDAQADRRRVCSAGAEAASCSAADAARTPQPREGAARFSGWTKLCTKRASPGAPAQLSPRPPLPLPLASGSQSSSSSMLRWTSDSDGKRFGAGIQSDHELAKGDDAQAPLDDKRAAKRRSSDGLRILSTTVSLELPCEVLSRSGRLSSGALHASRGQRGEGVAAVQAVATGPAVSTRGSRASSRTASSELERPHMGVAQRGVATAIAKDLDDSARERPYDSSLKPSMLCVASAALDPCCVRSGSRSSGRSGGVDVVRAVHVRGMTHPSRLAFFCDSMESDAVDIDSLLSASSLRSSVATNRLETGGGSALSSSLWAGGDARMPAVQRPCSAVGGFDLVEGALGVPGARRPPWGLSASLH